MVGEAFKTLYGTVTAIRDQIKAVEYARLYTVDQVMREAGNIVIDVYRGGTPSEAQASIIARKKAEIVDEARSMAEALRDRQIRQGVANVRMLRVDLVAQCVAASNDAAMIARAIEAGTFQPEWIN